MGMSQPAGLKRAYLLLLVCFALFSAATTLHEVNLANFLREHMGVGEWFRGFLELPRESQGFAVAFYVVLLGAFTERRIFSFAAVLAAIGLVGMSLLPASQIPDGLHGVLPGLPLILVVMIFSAGMHLAGLLQQIIIIERGDLATAGRRLGQFGFWRTLAMLVAAGLVWLLRETVAASFQSMFLLGAAFALASAFVMGQAMRGLGKARPSPRKMVAQRKFARYYVLAALFGVRKQVFLTFALWTLVTIYDQPVETVAVLWVATAGANLVFQPLIGRLIDRFGPRTVLTVDALLLVGVCLVYGYSAQLFAPQLALIVVGITYVVDHVLFFAGSARAVYVGSLATSSDELGGTLSLGVTIDHIFSMSVPLLGGIIWKAFGYQWVFAMAGLLALATAVVARGLPSNVLLAAASAKIPAVAGGGASQPES
jgi:hypothetical protein